MEIKAADVMKLRKMTGAGMMDCKNALMEAEGDFARAQDIIREKGKLVVAKRAEPTCCVSPARPTSLLRTPSSLLRPMR